MDVEPTKVASQLALVKVRALVQSLLFKFGSLFMLERARYQRSLDIVFALAV